MVSSFNELLALVQNKPTRRVALVAAEDPDLIKAAAKTQALGLAEFILLGDAPKITDILENTELPFEIIDSRSPAADSIRLIQENRADLLMKGKITTGELLKEVLKKESGLRQGQLLNHIAAIESPHYHKLLFISDGGINLSFDEQTFEYMIRNISDYLKRLEIAEPRFGMMTLVENVTEAIPETVIAGNVVEKMKAEFRIEGPIAPDVALSAKAAIKKGLESDIAGEVDVFLMPNTTAANHLVKGLVTLGGCKHGGVIVGAKVPIILISRSDSVEAKFHSILLGLV